MKKLSVTLSIKEAFGVALLYDEFRVALPVLQTIAVHLENCLDAPQLAPHNARLRHLIGNASAALALIDSNE